MICPNCGDEITTAGCMTCNLKLWNALQPKLVSAQPALTPFDIFNFGIDAGRAALKAEVLELIKQRKAIYKHTAIEFPSGASAQRGWELDELLIIVEAMK